MSEPNLKSSSSARCLSSLLPNEYRDELIDFEVGRSSGGIFEVSSVDCASWYSAGLATVASSFSISSLCQRLAY